jgi:hypothetical protein
MPTAAAIAIAPSFRGMITPSDLLRLEGALTFRSPRRDLEQKSGLLFVVEGQDFHFGLCLSNGRFRHRRDRDEIELQPNFSTGTDWTTIVEWSPTLLRISSGSSGENAMLAERTTAYCCPPVSLLRHARHLKLLPATTFTSVSELRSAVYQALGDLEEAIERRGAQEAFWNRPRVPRGKDRGGEATPKKESAIHSLISLLFDDLAIQRSIDVIRENKTGVGNLDFAFEGTVEGEGIVPICVEFKLAHARDLTHGLDTQLPMYMANRRALTASKAPRR